MKSPPVLVVVARRGRKSHSIRMRPIMKYAITMLLVCVGMFGAVAFSCGSAHAGPYTLEIVAQAGDVIDGRTITGFSPEVIRVGISDDREVAFFAFAASPEGTGLSLMTQRRFKLRQIGRAHV